MKLLKEFLIVYLLYPKRNVILAFNSFFISTSIMAFLLQTT